ncbi:MAG: hypothetical protein R3A10_01870 [Caldilineaceae bacterium]
MSGFRGFGEDNKRSLPVEKVATLRQNLAKSSAGPLDLVDHPAYDHPGNPRNPSCRYENVAADRQGVVDAWTDSRALEIIATRIRAL